MILNYIDKGASKPIVLLHGMAASLNYWNEYIDPLSKTNRVIAIDLLGFGRSPNSDTDYTTEKHIEAIRQTLKSLNVHEPIIIIGHSMGALLALKFAARFPDEVDRLMLVGMPIYVNSSEAKKDITKSKKILEWTYYGRSSQILCTTWCYLLRPLSKRLAPYYLPKQPKQVGADSVLHTWRAYSESLRHVIETQTVESDLKKLKIPTVLCYGDKESEVILHNAHSLKNLPKNIQTTFLNGTHSLPLEKPKELLNLLNS